MLHIKYALDDKTYTCWNSTDRVTTPSLIFNEDEVTRYTPLFVIDENKEGTLDQHWFYKCGDLSVNYNEQKYYAPLSRRYINTISDTISTTIRHSGKTGTTTSYQSKTITKEGNIPSGTSGHRQTSVSFGVTFASPPQVKEIKSNYSLSITDITTTGCSVHVWSLPQGVGVYFTLEITGQIPVTTTTYPNETHSANAQGIFEYGVTYPTEPTLTVDSGGVTATNNVENDSCLIQKTLTGTVAYNKTLTLSQAFSVTHKGDFGLN